MKKKTNKLKLAIIMILIVATCGMLCISAFDIDLCDYTPCCSKFAGYAEKVLKHVQCGEGCEATIRIYCPKCNAKFDKFTGIYSNCTHTKGNYEIEED